MRLGESTQISNQLDVIYNDIRSVPNYSSKIQQFLRQNETSSVHKQVRKNFPTRRIIAHFPYQIVMSDLIEYTAVGMSRNNQGYRYIMVCVCCFSKMAFARPLKRKTGLDSAIALEEIIKEMPDIPQSIVTDRGNEYYDHKVQKLFDRYGIHHYSITGKHKASIAERFIRTLKGRLERYFWANKTRKWIDVLPEFITNYNKTYHRSIKMAPIEVTDDNRQQVFNTLYPKEKIQTKARLSVGDRVRILKEKNIFEKGYTRSWSLEIYTISEALSENGVDYYKIEDLQGTKLPRFKYYWELNLVAKNDIEH